MSTRWPGGIINQTAPVPSGTFATSSASGLWTLEQQAYWKQQGLWPIPGNLPPNIEDVFSTWLYSGTNAPQTIPNGINLSGKGGLVWLKSRSGSTLSTYDKHILFDTVRGNTVSLSTNNTSVQESGWGDSYLRFLSNGFDTGTGGTAQQEYLNRSGVNYASWTFREQAKFFDVVTYTGDGTSGKTVAHSLGSVPGMIIVKITSGSGSWFVYHRSLGATQYINLNATPGASTSGGIWNNTEPTSSVFTLGNDGSVNSPGATYVAYLFAHNAGGFGASGNENVISCGSWTGASTINLGYEPQYILWKNISTSDWYVLDTMRGWSQSGYNYLLPNTSGAEANVDSPFIVPTATGFNTTSTLGGTWIYMAIRRGPMAVPTVGTSVFSPVARTGNATSNTPVTAGFPVDMFWNGIRNFDGEFPIYFDRLRGNDRILFSNATNAEFSTASVEVAFNRSNANTGVLIGTNNNGINGNGYGYVDHFFRRAPGFFDQVCYTGSGGNVSYNHNLTVVPEMMIVKARSTTGNWAVYHSALGIGTYMRLNTTGAPSTTGDFWYAAPTSTQFSVGTYSDIADPGVTYVAYLFATCPGVSKVGSYTGTGATQTIACGFTGGARYVLIKRTDSTGNWWVWDTARGMISGTDPRLTINSTTVEANNDWVLTTSTGFQIVTTDATVNASGGSYIFLAVA